MSSANTAKRQVARASRRKKFRPRESDFCVCGRPAQFGRDIADRRPLRPRGVRTPAYFCILCKSWRALQDSSLPLCSDISICSDGYGRAQPECVLDLPVWARSAGVMHPRLNCWLARSMPFLYTQRAASTAPPLPPPSKKKRGFFRRFLLYTTLLASAGYGASAYVATQTNNYRFRSEFSASTQEQ